MEGALLIIALAAIFTVMADCVLVPALEWAFGNLPDKQSDDLGAVDDRDAA